MAVDITGLQQYAQLYPEIIGKLANKETILGMFQPHTGFHPGPARLRIYESEGLLSNCCGVPESNSAFTEIDTEVACIQSGNEFCMEDMARYIQNMSFRYTAGNESAGSLEELIVNQELAAVALSVDKLVFQGDTNLADDQLNKVDGLIKLAKTNGAVELNITEGNAYTAIQKIAMSIPYEAYDMNGPMAILVGRDVYAQFKFTWVGLNLYHYAPGSTGIEALTVPGTNVQVIPARGLDGTGFAIASPLANIHWLTNLANDHMSLNWDYSSYQQVYFWRIKFLLGITFGIYDYVVLAKLDNDVIAAPSVLNINIANNPLLVSNDGTFAS